MALIILQYCLPILLGYTFFVGIAGRYNPFMRPAERVQRPAWLLGLWTGIAVATIAIVGLRVAFRMDLNELPALATPAATAFAMAMVPGLIAYFWYRSNVKRALLAADDVQNSDAAHSASDPEFDKTLSFDMTASNELDDTMPMPAAEILDIDEQATMWAHDMDEVEMSEDQLDETQLFAIDGIESNEPALMEASKLSIDDQLDMNVDETLNLDDAAAELAAEQEIDGAFEVELANAETQDAVAHYEEPAESMVSESEMLERLGSEQLAAQSEKDELQAQLETEAKAREELASMLITESQAREELAVKLDNESQTREALAAELAAEAKTREELSSKLDHEMSARQELEAKLEAELKARQEAEIQLTKAPMVTEAEMLERLNDAQLAAKSATAELQEKLDAEIKTRKELETHLRITRNGLGALESESRAYESDKAAALMKMEQELEEKIKRTSSAEARAEREAAKVVELENEMVQLREDSLRAVNESRVSVEARAKALSTANKATTFARQAMQIRSRLETQLNEAHAEIDNKQSTISSLIKALEKEKSRTQEEVASLAKQLRLHEKQLQARRTLEEVSKSVDNKLSTRLVKKVARARG